MSLGDLFPQNIKDQFAQRSINIGNALLIKLQDLQVNYDKYIILVGVNTQEKAVAYVIINTEINQNVFPSPYLQSLHLPIDCLRHAFLDHDSYIDCSNLKEFELEMLIAFITKNPERVVGNIDSTLLKDVHDNIKTNRIISAILKKKFGFV